MLVALLLCVAALGDEPARTPDAPLPSEVAAEIAQWVRELDHDRFVVRSMATESLIRAGKGAIAPVADAMVDSNLEVATRGIYVLRELALSKDRATQDAAATALERVADTASRSAARQAAEAISVLGEVRQQRAVQELQELGAKITLVDRSFAFGPVRQLTVEIGPAWTGTLDDLQRLKWTRDVHEISFIGKQITDDWVRTIEPLESLDRLVIKHASVTDDGLQPLRKLGRVSRVDLMYTPFTSGCLEHLKELKSLTLLRMYGTDISADAVDRFQAVALQVQVDHKMGAFLGVRCTQPPFPCEVMDVTAGSAAAAGGIQPRDLIVRYDGQPVADFEALRRLIARNKVGETVAVQVARGGSPLAVLVARQPGLELGLEAESTALGCRVTRLVPGGFAEKVGIRVDDLLMDVDGERVTQLDQLTQALQAEDPERDRSQITLLRNIQLLDVRVTFGEWTE